MQRSLNTSWLDGVEMRPAQYAAWLSTVYVLTASLYIVLSGQVALSIAATIEELEQIETYKGIGFVCFTALMLFGFSWWLFDRHLRVVRESVQHRQAFIASERAATTGIFTASIAHDFNNLLMVMSGSVYELQHADASTSSEEALNELSVAIRRGGEICQRLLMATKAQAQEPSTLDLVKLIEEAVALTKLHHKSRRRQISLSAPASLTFYGDVVLLHQLVINLLLNALDASVEQVTLHLERAGDRIIIEVDDDGAGVAPELKAKLFDAFFTTKPDGTGLGLVSVRVCAQAHRGHVHVLDSKLGGACFRVTLPVDAALESAQAPREVEDP